MPSIRRAAFFLILILLWGYWQPASLAQSSDNNTPDWGHLYHRFAEELDMPVNDSPKDGAAVWVFALD
jgi:hypothetical protein